MIDLSKEKYRDEMNEICQKNSLDAEDILLKRTKTAVTDISYKKRRINKLIVVAASLLLVISVGGTTALGAMGQGPLAGVFEKLLSIIGDEKTGRLVDRGYYYEVGEKKTDGIFTVEFMGVSGDKTNPMLLMKLHLEDEKPVAECEKLTLTVYPLLDKDLYDTKREDLAENKLDSDGYFAYQSTEAYRDPENTSDFYFSVQAYYAYEDIPSVIAIRSVVLPDGSEFKTDIVFDATLSFDQLKEVFEEYYTYEHPFKVGELTFYNYLIRFSEYESVAGICIDDTEGKHSKDDEMRLDEFFGEITKDILLEVDGKKYPIKEMGSFSYDRWDDHDTEYTGYIEVIFDRISYESAKKIRITYKGKTINRIK